MSPLQRELAESRWNALLTPRQSHLTASTVPLRSHIRLRLACGNPLPPVFISSASLMLFIHFMKSQRRLRLFSLQKGHKHSQRKCSREKRRRVWTDLKTSPKVSCDWPVDSCTRTHTHANAHGLIISSQHSRSETFFLENAGDEIHTHKNLCSDVKHEMRSDWTSL